jgi:hypothetical protein
VTSVFRALVEDAAVHLAGSVKHASTESLSRGSIFNSRIWRCVESMVSYLNADMIDSKLNEGGSKRRAALI